MNKSSANLPFFMIILALFIVSVGILHATKPKTMRKDDGALNDPAIQNKETAYRDVEPFLIADNIEDAVRALVEFDDSVAIAVLRDIVTDTHSMFSVHKKLNFMFAVAEFYQDKADIQRAIFELVLDNSDQWRGTVVLLTAMHSDSASVVPSFINYLKESSAKDSQGKSIFTVWGQESLSKALDENDFVSFKKLYAMGLSITPDYARKLISFAITERKSSAFISYILHEFSLDPNMRLPGNTTFLMIAARENNKEAAQALLDAGADANLAIGGKKAIDIAFKEGSVAVEALLRAWKK